MSNSAHKPTSLSSYTKAHDNHMQQLRRGPVVKHDSLKFKDWPGTITLKGEIACLGNILIQVDKTLIVVQSGPDPIVQTIAYSYNAWVRGHCTFLRYDNAHCHTGHADPHHKHILDWRTGKGRVYWVGEENWPSLAGVVHEIEEWYWEHREELPEPDSTPELGLWGPSQGEDDD